MSLKELGERLVAANRTGDLDALLANDYSPDAVSVEAVAMDAGRSRESKGLDAIRAKQDWWNAHMELRSLEVDGPFLHGEDRFAVVYRGEVSKKDTGEAFPLQEVAIYTASGGRIVREEFYYTIP